MRIFAHRGFSACYPENTIAAFQAAADAGADGIELDVQLTKDDQLAVLHDFTLDRTTNGSGAVRSHTAEAIRALKAENEPIPLLEDVLLWAAETKVRLNIELKHVPQDRHVMGEAVFEAVRAFPQQAPPIVSSFDHAALSFIQTKLPYAELGALTHANLAAPAEYLQKNGFHAWHFDYRMLGDDDLAALHDKNIHLRAYTVNSPAAIRRLDKHGIHAVITDNPAETKNLLSTL